jgi:cytochrome P450
MWALYALSLDPALQSRLRSELSSLSLPHVSSAHGNLPRALTADELSALNKLPLLDAVVRETLRLHAPVPTTVRVAVKDDVIPLAKPFVGRDGLERNAIQSVHAPRTQRLLLRM